MSRSTHESGTPGRSGSSATGHQLLAGFAGLRKGLRQWMQMNMPAATGTMTVPRATLLLGLTLKSEPAGMSELGEPLGLSPRNMTVLVDGLEKEGLVRRVAHPDDRRIKLVELTPAGKDVVEQELAPSQAAAAALFDDFTPEERGELLRLLTKVGDSLRARGIDMPSRDQG
ncbi:MULTISPECIES: MarR family winged helix-turn-helix transcriptional regulator [Streptomyces]|uniref:MarR family winged helix-turn-helix transcriptional regulator n=1 Tax=Streptomyces TaxID=1883 RepID=UPI00039F6B2C|nr:MULTISPECIES: MarR family transcriptional regulator [Streptomyces]